MDPVTVTIAHGSIDPSRSAAVADALSAWFGSPFWGAPPRRPLRLHVGTARGAARPVPELMGLADALRGGPVPARPLSVPRPLVDLAETATDVVSDDDLACDAPLEVRGDVGPPRTVPGIGGLLALLLLRRLDVMVGEGVLRALRGDGRAGRPAPLWSPDLPAPAHLLLPTAAGAALRSHVGALPGPLVVPPVAYVAVAGHLVGTSVEVRAGRSRLLGWLARGVGTPGPVRHPHPRLAARSMSVAAARRVLLPLAAVAALLPARVPTRTVRWPFQLLSGALAAVPITALADPQARRLVRGR